MTQTTGSSAPSRALVTGATGFVGGWLARRLLEKGYEVRALKREEGPLEGELLDLQKSGARLDVRSGDVLSDESLRSACEGVDAVFHLAGLIAHSEAGRAAMEKVNVEGTRNVVEACARAGVRRLVNMSSVAAVGASYVPRGLLREDSSNPSAELRLAYGETKRKAEAIALAAAKAGRIEAVSVCPGTIYGPGDARKDTRGSMLKVARGQMPYYSSGGVNVIDVESACDALISAASAGRSGERYLIGGENLLLRDLFALIAREAGARPPWLYLPNAVILAVGRVGDLREARGARPSLTSEQAWNAILFHWFDSSKARAELALRPRPAREAIAASVRWSRENGLL
jgi:dihydroflavonol-4-reductase